ncbi:MAG: hypothetical protein QOG80_2545 [Pseudonocardiales bacterium]|jgi:hypothetical protein|nr:hypothetical protein [Pseudonocardiales bacterium]
MTENDDLFGDSVYQQGGEDPVGDTDDLDPIEALTGDDPDEEMQTGYSPPEREPHNLRDAPTAFEEFEGESLDQKLAEEEPDVAPEDVAFDDEQPRAGRLVAPDEGAHEDEEKDEVAADLGPAGYGSSAEEAAMHIIDGDEVDFD